MGKPGRPKKQSVMDTLAVRLPDDLVGRIDKYAETIRTEFPLFNVTRADAVRQLLGAGLKAEEERIRKRSKN